MLKTPGSHTDDASLFFFEILKEAIFTWWVDTIYIPICSICKYMFHLWIVLKMLDTF